jgi:hypothetical protein
MEQRICKGLSDPGKAANLMVEGSFSLGRSISRGRPEISRASNKTLHRLSGKYRSQRRRKSKSLVEHLRQKEIHKTSDLEEIIVFLATGGLEYLAPRFASAGLSKKRQLLALDYEVRYSVMLRLSSFCATLF